MGVFVVVTTFLLCTNIAEISLNQVFMSVSSVFSHSLIMLPQKESRSIASPLIEGMESNGFIMLRLLMSTVSLVTVTLGECDGIEVLLADGQ